MATAARRYLLTMARKISGRGWFGAVFGMSAWLAVLAVLATMRRARLGLFLTALAVIQCGGAMALTSLRASWGASRALGWLVAGSALVALAALVAVDLAGEMDWLRRFAAVGTGATISPYWFLLVFPALGWVVRHRRPDPSR